MAFRIKYITIISGISLLSYVGCRNYLYKASGCSHIDFSMTDLTRKEMSRACGYMAHANIPVFLRKSIYQTYSSFYECRLDEMPYDYDFNKFDTFSDFFRREFRPGIRPIDLMATLVSPVDGIVLFCGKVSDKSLIDVKNLYIPLDKFLGNSFPCKNKESSIFCCVIYLSPGDFHHFYSPTDWKVNSRLHIPGCLYSVRPDVVSKKRDILDLNERVNYFGDWKHGNFAFSAVGAMNVGSVIVPKDATLITNNKIIKSQNRDFKSEMKIDFTNGEKMGTFDLGSTVVLIFEAPSDMDFTIEPNQRVIVGKRIF